MPTPRPKPNIEIERSLQKEALFRAAAEEVLAVHHDEVDEGDDL